MNGRSTLLELPVELIEKVTPFLDLKSCCFFSRSNMSLKKVDQKHWEDLLTTRFPDHSKELNEFKEAKDTIDYRYEYFAIEKSELGKYDPEFITWVNIFKSGNVDALEQRVKKDIENEKTNCANDPVRLAQVPTYEKAVIQLLFMLYLHPDRSGRDAIYWAIKNKHQKLLDHIYECGLSEYVFNDESKPIASQRNSHNMTVLQLATVTNQSMATINNLLKQGAGVNVPGYIGNFPKSQNPDVMHTLATPLSTAAMYGQNDLVIRYLDLGADINASAYFNALYHESIGLGLDIALPLSYTALSIASAAGSLEAVKTLVTRGANPNGIEEEKDNNFRGELPIVQCSKGGHIEVAKYLISVRADSTKIGFLDYDRASGLLTNGNILQIAVANGRFSYTKYLVDVLHFDAEIIEANVLHRSLLHINIYNKLGTNDPRDTRLHYALVDFLIARGVNVNAIDCNKMTALECAIQRECYKYVPFLILRNPVFVADECLAPDHFSMKNLRQMFEFAHVPKQYQKEFEVLAKTRTIEKPYLNPERLKDFYKVLAEVPLREESYGKAEMERRRVYVLKSFTLFMDLNNAICVRATREKQQHKYKH